MAVSRADNELLANRTPRSLRRCPDHAERCAADTVRHAWSGHEAKPDPLVQMPCRIIVPDVEAQPDAAPRRLAHHSQQQPPADTLPAPIRRDADRDLGRARIDIEGRFLLGCELPRPSRADRAGISFG